ncbi:UDP-galactose transporter senju [Planococcus citri]|uniref:UDP-galactose transporter senju n=1 Tax=Planococcus citri TaxID=170843 RepID=UPI0031F94217
MYKANLHDLFPSKWSGVIFLMYMFLFICQGLLVTSSQESNNSYHYNTVVVVLLTEMMKLIISMVIYTSRNGSFSIFNQAIVHIKLLWLYFIPSLLYCFYNNLSFVNLLNYDPSTYSILLQLRVVITGILFQMLFKKILTKTQWISLILLTFGCMMKNIDLDFHDSVVLPSAIASDPSSMGKKDGMGLNSGTIFILIQVLCSCLAGVYIEFLLKREGLHVDIFVQNTFLYVDSIVCNLLVLLWQWDVTVFSQQSFQHIFNLKVLLVILNNAAVGIVASFFLKYLNSILKTVASALELVFIAILTWIIFDVPIKSNAAVSIIVIILSIILYSKNPVQNPAPSEPKHKENYTDV